MKVGKMRAFICGQWVDVDAVDYLNGEVEYNSRKQGGVWVCDTASFDDVGAMEARSEISEADIFKRADEARIKTRGRD